MGWTDERVARLRHLWTEGLSANQIAKDLGGVTRNAVIGKIHRLGLAGRTYSTPRRVTRPVRAARPRVARVFNPYTGVQKAPAEDKLTAELAGIRALPALVSESGAARTVATLRAEECKFPIGDPQEASFAFCGRGAGAHGSYCAEHQRLVYQPRSRPYKPREQKRDRAHDSQLKQLENMMRNRGGGFARLEREFGL